MWIPNRRIIRPYDKPPFAWTQRFGLNKKHPLASGLVGCWLMNEGTGNKVYDLSGNRKDGVFYNSPTWTSGKYGSAVEFLNTSSQYIQGEAPVTSLPITLVGFCRTAADTRPTYPLFLGDASSSGDHYALEINPGANVFRYWYRNGGVLFITSAGVAQDTDYMIAATSEAADHRLYVNGVLTNSDTTNSVATGIDIFSIGALRDSSPTYGDGKVYCAYIYNRILTASEIAHLYREPFCFIESPVQIIGKVPVPGGANAPTGHLYGPLVGCFGGPI